MHHDKSLQLFNPLFSKWVLFSILLLVFCTSAIQPVPSDKKIIPGLQESVANGSKVHILVLLDPLESAQGGAYMGRMGNDQAGKAVDHLRERASSLQAPILKYLDALQIEYRSYWVVNAIALEGDWKLIQRLADFSEVVLIEPDMAFHVDLGNSIAGLSGVDRPDTSMNIQPNLSQVRAPEVWDRGVMGQGTVIAIADTGVFWMHPALQEQYRGWDGASAIHDYNWWDSIHETISGLPNSCGYDVTYPCDDYGHGTHVAGIAAGTDGGINQIGMAPEARWIGCRNMDHGVGRPSTYIECLQFFAAPTDLSGNNPRPDLRPDVINNSYSCPASEQCESHSLQQAVENVRSMGIFMSVSAGNSGPSCGTINSPPALEEAVFTIGAVGSTDIIASFSSRGPVTIDENPLTKPDLVAPGISIFSSLFTGGYGTMSGTSMAAPHVSGAVALLWSAFPTLRRDVLQTELLLEATAIHLPSSQGCGGDSTSQIPNNTYGWGRLDVKAAYDVYWPLQLKQILLPIYK